jgi:hypothetical protein
VFGSNGFDESSDDSFDFGGEFLKFLGLRVVEFLGEAKLITDFFS